MQISIGRHWVIELSVRVSRACARADAIANRCSVSRMRRMTPRSRDLQWEHDKLAGQMLSGWLDRPEDWRS
jgi:hypothetical protein